MAGTFPDKVDTEATTIMFPEYECPVCHDDLKEPKILPCTHLTCKTCLLTWLTKSEGKGGCPLCRAPVTLGTGDIKTQVDALPTNLAIISLIQSRQVLLSPHVCNICDNVNAESVCLQCNVKLCQTCVKNHARIPATKDHVMEVISTLTVQQLAKTNRSMCELHPDRQAELFCSTHKVLICILCGTTGHGNCRDKKAVEDVAEEKREEFRLQAIGMRQNQWALETQIQEVKDTVKDMGQRTTVLFDDLVQCVEERRHQVEQMLEEVTTKLLTDLETSRATLACNSATVEGLLESSSGSILGMVGSLGAKLDAVAKQHSIDQHRKTVDLIFNTNTVAKLKGVLAELGDVRRSRSRAKQRRTSSGEPGNAKRRRIMSISSSNGSIMSVGKRFGSSPSIGSGSASDGGSSFRRSASRSRSPSWPRSRSPSGSRSRSPSGSRSRSPSGSRSRSPSGSRSRSPSGSRSGSPIALDMSSESDY